MGKIFISIGLAILAVAPLGAASIYSQGAPPIVVGEAKYWISSTGKTHCKGCRYYLKGKGHLSDTPSGKACKLCGSTR